MSEERIRVVIDTQIFLRAVINLKSLPAKIVFDLRQQYQLIVSEETVAEVRDVLHRAKVQTKFPHLTDQLAEAIIQLLLAGEVTSVDEVPAISRDPKDDIFLACAQAGHADYIVSEDQDLLVLNPYGNIHIVNASDFLLILQRPAERGELPLGEN